MVGTFAYTVIGRGAVRPFWLTATIVRLPGAASPATSAVTSQNNDPSLTSPRLMSFTVTPADGAISTPVTSPRPGTPRCSTLLWPATSCVGKNPSMTFGSPGAGAAGGATSEASTFTPAAKTLDVDLILFLPVPVRSPAPSRIRP